MTTLFLSHSTADKSFARMLADKLSEVGVDVWIDEAEIHVGDSLIQKISQAIDDVDYVAAVLSTKSVASNWVASELQWAMTREIRGQRVIVLPILIERCILPVFLRDKLYADFTVPSRFDSEFRKLFRTLNAYRSASISRTHLVNTPHSGTRFLSENIGSLDVGSVMHDRGKNWAGFRHARQMRQLGWMCNFAGFLLMLFGFLLRVRTGKMIHMVVLGILGFIVWTVGATTKLSSSLRMRAYDRDKNLLLVDEETPTYLVPFDRNWFALYRNGRQEPLYRWSLITEVTAGIVLVLALLFIIAMVVFWRP